MPFFINAAVTAPVVAVLSGAQYLTTPTQRPVPSATWRELIKRVWEVDPLLCPRCGVYVCWIIKVVYHEVTKGEWLAVNSQLGVMVSWWWKSLASTCGRKTTRRPRWARPSNFLSGAPCRPHAPLRRPSHHKAAVSRAFARKHQLLSVSAPFRPRTGGGSCFNSSGSTLNTTHLRRILSDFRQAPACSSVNTSCSDVIALCSTACLSSSTVLLPRLSRAVPVRFQGLEITGVSVSKPWIATTRLGTRRRWAVGSWRRLFARVMGRAAHPSCPAGPNDRRTRSPAPTFAK